jgi:hypothetical protein
MPVPEFTAVRRCAHTTGRLEHPGTTHGIASTNFRCIGHLRLRRII